MKEQKLVQGKCRVKGADGERFIYIQQNGRKFHYRFEQSQNGKFIVAWRPSLNPLQDKNKQACLIENGNRVLWCEEFEIVNTCNVSNNGTVVMLVHNWFPARDIDNRPGFLKRDSLIIIHKDRDKFQLKFDTREEIVALALSQNGAYLIYNLQRYRPDDYQLVLYNINSNKEEWRYKYPRKQIILELVFKDDHILVYARPRSPGYVGKRYSFTLDLTGRKVPNDLKEMQKQKERDSLAAKEDDLADQVGRILHETLAGIVPTIEVDKRCESGTRISSRGWSNIMSGRCPLPALHIMIYSTDQFHTESSRAKIEEQGYRFFFHMQVVAKTAEERDKISENCIQTLIQQEDNLEKKGLVFATKFRSRVIGHYPGSGPYFRTDISCILIFPAKQKIRQRPQSWREVINLQPDESIVVVNEIFLKSPFGNLDGKLVLTTTRLTILIKNPISEQFKKIDLSPEKAQDIVFGGKDEKYMVRQHGSEEDRTHTRIYFKPGQEGSFEMFRKEFELFKKSRHL